MGVYWSILIWVFLIGFMQPDENNPITSNEAKAYRAKWGMALLLMLPVIFFAFARSYVMDTTAYIDMFCKTPDQMQYFDEYMDSQMGSQLFYGCQMLFKCYVSKDPFLWVGFIAIIQGLLVTRFFQQYSLNVAMSVYIFVASTQFTWMYNGIRQFMAVAILMAMTDWILKNKWYYYIPMVMLIGGFQKIFEWCHLGDTPWFLGGIHQSALLMIPLFFLLRCKPWGKMMWVFVAVFAVLAMTGVLGEIIGDAAQETEYAQDFKDMDDYAAQEIIVDDGANPIRMIVPLVPAVMAFMKRKEIEAMSEEECPTIIRLQINAAVITTVLYGCSVVSSGILIGRLPIYVELYTFCLIPWLILHPYKKSSNILAIGVYGAYFLWFLYQMYIAWGGPQYYSWLF